MDDWYLDDSVDPINESSFTNVASEPHSWTDVSPHEAFEVTSSAGRRKAWVDALHEMDNLRQNVYIACGRCIP